MGFYMEGVFREFRVIIYADSCLEKLVKINFKLQLIDNQYFNK